MITGIASMSAPVVRVITRLNIGGPSIQAVTLTERLETHGFHTHLIHGRVGDSEGDMSYLLPPTATARRLPELQRSLAPLDDAVAFWRLYRLLREIRPALVHTHMAKAGALGRAAAALYNRTVRRSARARVVHTYHGHVLEGYFGRARTAAFINAERGLAGVTDCLVAISPRIREELLHDHRIGHASQYAVVPLGFDLAPFAAVDVTARRQARLALGIPAEAPTIATVGRLTAIKQHELMLRAARRIVDVSPDTVVLIAGDGERRMELETLSRELRLERNLRFLGWRRDLATVYAATDVFMLTSRNEGTPVALIEAMASGVPGVSTDVGGVGDVISNEATGVRVAMHDAETLAAAVLSLLRDDTRRERMGAAARAHVLARFSLDRLVDDIAALYRRLL
jgi:glycosyltransferase involved in cell wall biosynthesis